MFSKFILPGNIISCWAWPYYVFIDNTKSFLEVSNILISPGKGLNIPEGSSSEFFQLWVILTYCKAIYKEILGSSPFFVNDKRQRPYCIIDTIARTLSFPNLPFKSNDKIRRTVDVVRTLQVREKCLASTRNQTQEIMLTVLYIYQSSHRVHLIRVQLALAFSIYLTKASV